MSKWTEERELRLVELCSIRQSEIDGTGNSNDINKRRNSAWDYITSLLNAETRSNFDKNQVKKKYQNLKSSAKSKIAENVKSRNKTGGGLHISKALTEAEKQLEGTLGQTRGFTGEKNYVESRFFSQVSNNNQNQTSDSIFNQVSKYLYQMSKLLPPLHTHEYQVKAPSTHAFFHSFFCFCVCYPKSGMVSRARLV